ncbi:hypothetical protein [Prevotella koreensis]
MSRKNKKKRQNALSTEEIIYALKELNCWIRSIENSMWLISALLLAATAYSFKEIYDMACNMKFIRIVSLFMIFLWIVYLGFLKDISYKMQTYLKKAEAYEKQLSIDILADGQKEYRKENLDEKYFSRGYCKPMNSIIFWNTPLMKGLLYIALLQILFWSCKFLCSIHFCLCNFFNNVF